jgi:hypothetical protein
MTPAGLLNVSRNWLTTISTTVASLPRNSNRGNSGGGSASSTLRHWPRYGDDAARWAVAVIVMACLCAVLGAVYAFLHSSRMGRRSTSRSHKHIDTKHRLSADEPVSSAQSTHIFLFRK